MNQKIEIRKFFLEKRQKLTLGQLEAQSQKITTLFFDFLEKQPVKVLHCFLPILSKKEINTWLIIHQLWEKYPDIQVVVPKLIPKQKKMEHLLLTPETDLVKNDWGIEEPINSKEILIQEIDLVIVPLLAFDKAGNRVGYGGGFYDEFLKDCRKDTLKIGLSLFEPIELIEEIYESDIKLNFCISSEHVWEFSSFRR